MTMNGAAGAAASARTRLLGEGRNNRRSAGRWSLLARSGHSATLVGSDVFIIGGCHGNRDAELRFKDVLRLDTTTGAVVVAVEEDRSPLTPCKHHSATLLNEKEIWVVGGATREQVLGDVHVLDATTLKWRRPVISGDTALLQRTAHGACVSPTHPHVLLIHGGFGGDSVELLGSLVALDTRRRHVELLAPPGPAPAPRAYHSFTAVAEWCVAFGGRREDGPCSAGPGSLHIYHPASARWFKPTRVLGPEPPARSSHRAVAVPPGSMLLFGGTDISRQRLDDAHLLLLAAAGPDAACPALRWVPVSGSGSAAAVPSLSGPQRTHRSRSPSPVPGVNTGRSSGVPGIGLAASSHAMVPAPPGEEPGAIVVGGYEGTQWWSGALAIDLAGPHGAGSTRQEVFASFVDALRPVAGACGAEGGGGGRAPPLPTRLRAGKRASQPLDLRPSGAASAPPSPVDHISPLTDRGLPAITEEGGVAANGPTEGLSGGLLDAAALPDPKRARLDAATQGVGDAGWQRSRTRPPGASAEGMALSGMTREQLEGEVARGWAATRNLERQVWDLQELLAGARSESERLAEKLRVTDTQWLRTATERDEIQAEAERQRAEAERARELHTELETARQNMQGLERRLKRAERTAKDADQRVADAKAERDKARETLESRTHTFDEAKVKIKAAMDQRDQTIADLQRRVRDAEAAAEECRLTAAKEARRRREEQEDASRQRATLRADNDRLGRELRAAQGEAEAQRSEAAILRSRATTLGAERDAAKDELARVTDERDRAVRELPQVKGELQAARAEVERLQGQLSVAAAEHTKASVRADEALAAVEGAVAALKRAGHGLRSGPSPAPL
ncbi:unnamed protein product [Pedinophyceae sp. YPF-701]|nr:unnamed protein product [Pedinophyceae sp. YPF-701]